MDDCNVCMYGMWDAYGNLALIGTNNDALMKSTLILVSYRNFITMSSS